MMAWEQLRADAPPGFGFTPIPWSAIYFYAAAHGELGELDLLVRMIWALDREQARVETEKRKIEEARRDGPHNSDSSRSFGGRIRKS